jgi:hypothetical protein
MEPEPEGMGTEGEEAEDIIEGDEENSKEDEQDKEVEEPKQEPIEEKGGSCTNEVDPEFQVEDKYI